jgi:hypothetical protein
MVDFSEKLAQNKAARELFRVFDLKLIPSAREKELEIFILELNENLRGSKSSEEKNMAVKSLRKLAKEIKGLIIKRENDKTNID